VSVVIVDELDILRNPQCARTFFVHVLDRSPRRHLNTPVSRQRRAPRQLHNSAARNHRTRTIVPTEERIARDKLIPALLLFRRWQIPCARSGNHCLYTGPGYLFGKLPQLGIPDFHNKAIPQTVKKSGQFGQTRRKDPAGRNDNRQRPNRPDAAAPGQQRLDHHNDNRHNGKKADCGSCQFGGPEGWEHHRHAGPPAGVVNDGPRRKAQQEHDDTQNTGRSHCHISDHPARGNPLFVGAHQCHGRTASMPVTVSSPCIRSGICNPIPHGRTIPAIPSRVTPSGPNAYDKAINPFGRYDRHTVAAPGTPPHRPRAAGTPQTGQNM
jgi:hypothetical protein